MINFLKFFVKYILICIAVLGSIAIVGGLVYVSVGAIERKPAVVLKEDAQYLYVRSYSLYNEDSCVRKYHKPIRYKGVVTYKSSHFVGLVGKGGHYEYHTYIKYAYNKVHGETGYSYYHAHNNGDTVIIETSFYPYEITKPLN